MLNVKKHLLTPAVKDNLVAVSLNRNFRFKFLTEIKTQSYLRSLKDIKLVFHILWHLTIY